MIEREKYIKELKDRAKDSKVYKRFQLIGLEISRVLEDEKHKALYIKLAKEHSEDELLKLAKDIAEKRDIKNKGAYFMTLLKQKRG